MGDDARMSQPQEKPSEPTTDDEKCSATKTNRTPESVEQPKPLKLNASSPKPTLLITSHGKIVMLGSCRQGGLIKQGLDAAGYHLMETRGGLQALQQFSRMGAMQPLYINQVFFDEHTDEAQDKTA